MSTLNIKDLQASLTLDQGDLAKVRGGYAGYVLPGWPVGGYGQDFSLEASQSLMQGQSVVNNNGNNAAFVCGITSTVNPTQHGSNNISL
jgi:hypothetical protein